MASTGNRVRLGAVSVAIAGILFVLYPAIRPFSDETSLQGAQAFASAAWIVAHMLAMAGFILVGLGLIGLHAALPKASGERLAFLSLVVWVVGAGLTLTFYEAEAHGLHAIGAAAVRQLNVALVSLANDVRSGPGLVVFLVGLLLLGDRLRHHCYRNLEISRVAKVERRSLRAGLRVLHSAVFRKSATARRARATGREWMSLDRR